MNEINFSDKISFDEYNELRTKVEWKPLSKRQFEMALPNSLFFTVARIDGEVVGMVRVVGDGGYHYIIVDVIVSPKYQKHGIGRILIGKCLDYVDAHTENGESVLINLSAAKGKEGFYERLGFTRRPNDERGAGMYIQLNKK